MTQDCGISFSGTLRLVMIKSWSIDWSGELSKVGIKLFQKSTRTCSFFSCSKANCSGVTKTKRNEFFSQRRNKEILEFFIGNKILKLGISWNKNSKIEIGRGRVEKNYWKQPKKSGENRQNSTDFSRHCGKLFRLLLVRIKENLFKHFLRIESLSENDRSKREKMFDFLVRFDLLKSLMRSALRVCSCRSRNVDSSNKRWVCSVLSEETFVTVSIRTVKLSSPVKTFNEKNPLR